VIVQVCRADGVVIGKFEEADFRDKIQRGELPIEQYRYWHPGMNEWKPIAEYRAPGRVTTILGNIPTREMKRAELAGKSQPQQQGDTFFKKLFRREKGR
jgi:hypothetical protein